MKLKMQTYYLNKNLCLRIKAQAKKQRISMSKLAEMGLEQYLDSPKHSTTLEDQENRSALDELDRLKKKLEMD